jgi:putative transposase
LNAHLVESVAELQALSSSWLHSYNTERPHDSLGRVPPLTFLPRPQPAAASPLEVST